MCKLLRRIFGAHPEHGGLGRVQAVVHQLRRGIHHGLHAGVASPVLPGGNLQLARQHLAVHRAVEGVVVGNAAAVHQLDGVARQSAQVHGGLSAAQVDALALLLKEHALEEERRQVHRVFHQQVLGFNGCQHGIEPVGGAVRAVLHRRSAHHAHGFRSLTGVGVAAAAVARASRRKQHQGKAKKSTFAQHAAKIQKKSVCAHILIRFNKLAPEGGYQGGKKR